ncbi:MAG: ribbon-helix-helix protein, CopG family [Halobaculum sp.]
MTSGALDMTEVTVELSESELEEIDEIALRDHRDNREAAVRELLDKWLKSRDDEG